MRRITSLTSTKSAATASPVVVRSPYDNRAVAEISRATRAVVESAIGAAWEARPVMQAISPHERAAVLERLADSVAACRDELAQMLEEEAGKPIALARVEVDRCRQTCLDAALWARQPLDQAISLEGSPSGANRYGLLRRFPVGVVAAITPFNFPLNLVAHKVAPAIAAGCPLILKPASQTPSMGLRLAELALAAGVPPAGLQVLLLSGADADPLVTDERIAMITFTGSAEVGWGIKTRAGRKRVTLELGGNAAAIVEPDADWGYAAQRLANGAFAFAGQSCISVQRVYVHESIAASFIDALVAAAESLPSGDPRDERTVCGPLIDAANADRVTAWIKRALARRARLGYGNRRDGNVIAPTVLIDAPDDAEVSCCEVFGPVVTVSSYGDFPEALARVNNSRYGLQAGIFTNDWRKIWQAFETLEVGGIVHNDAPTFRVDAMPYGGVKESGTGREGPRWAIDEMTEPRLLVLSTAKG